MTCYRYLTKGGQFLVESYGTLFSNAPKIAGSPFDFRGKINIIEKNAVGVVSVRNVKAIIIGNGVDSAVIYISSSYVHLSLPHC